MTDILIIFSAEYLPFLIAIGGFRILMMGELYNQKKEIFKLSILVAGTALILDKILNALVYSPRPFVVENITPLIPHITNNGFPSEHTLFVILISGIVFLYNRKAGIILGTLSVIVGIGRVLAKVHNPIDILGSIVIGMISIYIGNYVYHKFIAKKI